MDDPDNCVTCSGCGDVRPATPGPCERCGDTRQTNAKMLGSTINMHTSLTAHKPPSAANASEAVRIASDELSISADFHSVSGTTEFTAQGRVPQGEEPSVPCAKIFLEHLRSLGEEWEIMDDLPEEPGVDVFAQSAGGQIMKLQHTRAISSQEFWRGMSRGSGTGLHMLEIAANALLEAIERKRRQSARDIVLLLDATIAVGVAFEAVVKEFLNRHATTAKSAGFAAIWVVGPVAGLVTQIA